MEKSSFSNLPHVKFALLLTVVMMERDHDISLSREAGNVCTCEVLPLNV